jgi:hypothetical protein
MAGKENPNPPLPTRLASRFVAIVGGFGLAVGTGLFTFLGRIPGKGALLDLFPKSMRLFSIPLSIFLTGIIALSIQFYSGESINRAALRRKFKWGLISLLAGSLLFIVFLNWLVVPVPIKGGESTVPVVIGFSRSASCGCEPPGVNDLECIRQLSLDESKLATCWNTGPSRLLLLLSYLLLISGFAALAGLYLLQETVRRRERYRAGQRKRKAARRRASPGATREEPIHNTDDSPPHGTS